MTIIKQWLEIEETDSDGWHWLIDMSLMLSTYHCIYGQGCHGINGLPDAGCCAFGVVIDTKKELKDLEAKAALLTPDEWENYGLVPIAETHYKRDDGPQHNTTVIKRREGKKPKIMSDNMEGDVCIFSNSPSFPAGQGCAFHHHAVNLGESPIDWKPYACWMQPLTLDTIAARKLYVLRFSGEEDWFDARTDPNDKDSGFKWWCGNEVDAYQSDQPVFRTLAAELERIIDSPPTYVEFRTRCEAEWKRLSRKPQALQGVTVPITLSKGR